MEILWQKFLAELTKAQPLEYIAVITGIASVYFSRIQNILVYPVGLVSTVIYIFLSIQGDLYGEASVNLYYTIMSVTGWLAWNKKNLKKQIILQVSYSDTTLWKKQLLFFAFFYVALFAILSYIKTGFSKDTIPWADAFASATAFTGMWLMNKKKVESWYWWIATDIVSVPLFYVKGYALSSVYYAILFFMAISGLFAWIRSANRLNLPNGKTQ
jgi:nicotinamide mononucleotide transporter